MPPVPHRLSTHELAVTTPAIEVSPKPDLSQIDGQEDKLRVACEVIAPAALINDEQFDYTMFEITKIYDPRYWSLSNISAMGRRRHDDLILDIAGGSGVSRVVPNLTWGRLDEGDINKRLTTYDDEGVTTVIVSPPEKPKIHGYRTYSHEDPLSALPLMKLVQDAGNFTVGLVVYAEGHPKAKKKDSAKSEFERIGAEIALADFIVTKPVFHVDPVLHLADRMREAGIEKPITAGIMPFKHPLLAEEHAKQYNAKFNTPELLKQREKAERRAMRRTRRTSIEAQANAQSDALRYLGVEFTARLGKQLVRELGNKSLHLYTGNHPKLAVDTLVKLGVVS